MKKIAEKPYAAGLAPESVEANNALKAEALRNALKAGLIGLGGGATLAAILGLPQVIKKPKIPSYPLQTEVELPYPQEVKKTAAPATNAIIADWPLGAGAFESAVGATKAQDKVDGAMYGGARGLLHGAAALPGALVGEAVGQKMVQQLRAPRGQMSSFARFARKPVIGHRRMLPMLSSVLGGVTSGIAAKPLVDLAAEKTMGPPPKPKPKAETPSDKTEKPEEKKADWADAVARHSLSATPGDPMPTVGSPRWTRGDSQTSVNAIPWAVPAAVGAGLTGLWGGHEIIRKILQKRRKAELDRDLQAAQKEYEEAMLSQYDPSKLRSLTSIKEASSKTVLDVCFDAMEKRGFLGIDFNDLAGRGAGAYLTLAGLLGTASGVGVYKWLQSRSGEKTLKDALKRRAVLRGLQNPTELYVRPVPVEYVGGKEDTSDNS